MVDEDEHKKRFKLVSDLFSKKKSQEFEPLIQRNVCALLTSYLGRGRELDYYY